jgi:hypothetical protein
MYGLSCLDLVMDLYIQKNAHSIRLTIPAIFGVLVFLIKLIPPPISELFQIFTALFITIAALTVRRSGGAIYTCVIAGLLDALYTGLPIALALFVIRGGTFDLALSLSKFWKSPSIIKIAASSIFSSLITGIAAYLTIVKWLKIIEVPTEFFMLFVAISLVLSGVGSVIGLKLWRRLLIL